MLDSDFRMNSYTNIIHTPKKKTLSKQANNGVQRKLGLWPHPQNLYMMNNLKVFIEKPQ